MFLGGCIFCLFFVRFSGGIFYECLYMHTIILPNQKFFYYIIQVQFFLSASNFFLLLLHGFWREKITTDHDKFIAIMNE